MRFSVQASWSADSSELSGPAEWVEHRVDEVILPVRPKGNVLLAKSRFGRINPEAITNPHCTKRSLSA